MGTLGLHESRPSEQAKSSLSLFTKNDILFGAMRVYFHRVSLAPYEGITRNTTFVLRPNSPEYLAFALLLLDRDSTIDYASATSKGSTMPYAVWDGALADMQATIPDLATAAAFNDHVEPLLTLVRDGYNESRRLAALRDALRPELLSGRVRVPVEEGV
ncbi:restriction endonuclease subunit S [Microbacterium gubbeenense]|uniref:restriction endonuclease subunit S n=1 Tax=Microbacterium TaxID=33882 RepID=UPI001B7F8B0F|nr:hypothetical protein [Microbacterium gubbeenense]